MAEAENPPAPSERPLRDLVLSVVSACTDRKGLSFYALKMALASEGYEYKLYHLKRAVLRLVKSGELIQENKCGLNGRFKVPKPEKGGKKKAAEKAKKCSTKEPKKKEPKKPRKPKNAVVVTLE